MIKKYSDFMKINELNSSTYRKAAEKLNKLGGLHKKRGDELSKWSYIKDAKDIGTFNMNFDVVEGVKSRKTKDLYIAPKDRSDLDINYQKVVEEGPIPVYIIGGMVDDLYEFYESPETDLEYISFSVYAISEKSPNVSSCFRILVEVEWKDDVMYIKEGDAFIEPGYCDGVDVEGIALFSDRGSANKFKREYLTRENLTKRFDLMEGLREFFLEYSNAKDEDMMFEKLRNIPTNKLYK